MQDTGDESVVNSILTELGILRPQGSREDALTLEQQEVIAAYRAGRMTEEEILKHLSQDPALSGHLSFPDETPTG
ncbi:hypothetical protein SAMN03159496_06307 [Rhizobium sp. NFR07]|uniref:hypothetical protein n=1 Tax=Rhizobium sp. NFR07 TaxID=1566262 RepID=UPI0008E0BB67|nr:hypothetical protein [Rhizobium sp. NFR07]SFB63733.1 hypothetical protein SAMN03159496_06307 [Rhizobium sp. NFR07]